MTFKKVLILCALCFAGVVCKNSYKICTPAQYQSACEQMLDIPTKSKALLECVPARDRMECLSLVQQRQADFVPVDPEDMYVASKIPNQDFVVFQEFRTKDEPDAEFRYEAVIVIRKDQPINSLDQLKGLKSCHTGVNRNVGYKIPLTMLMKRAVFPKMNDYSISPKENELKALATFFKQSCLVGTWSPDPNTLSTWKSRYSQLCALCENPTKCDYPDIYSGYEGALRCLAHHGGDVAFTKVIYVRKFFGLPVGTIPAAQSNENPDDYAYLCADGSKVPIREKACSWAARPWQGLIGHNDVLAKITTLREKIKQLAEAGAATNATNSVWFTKVLGLSPTHYHVADNIAIKPADYLNKANYTEVIERGHGPPEPVVRMCVSSRVSLAKCRDLSVFAFSRDIRPRLDCVQENSETDCLKSVQDNGSDLTSVDDMKVASAANKYNLHPVFHEVYGDKKTPYYAVAIVKKGSNIDKIEHLRGKKSCHSKYGSFAGLDAPLYALVNKNMIQSDQCLKNLADFFAGSCLPEVDKPANNPRCDNVSKLTSTCTEDNSPLQCLEQNGDVAFVSSAELAQYDSSRFELLCLNRDSVGRDILSNYTTCNIAMIPSRTWLSAKELIADISIAHTPLSLAQMLESRTDLFNIYGEFLKNNNVIFNNAATGLATTEKADFDKFKAIYSAAAKCGMA